MDEIGSAAVSAASAPEASLFISVCYKLAVLCFPGNRHLCSEAEGAPRRNAADQSPGSVIVQDHSFLFQKPCRHTFHLKLFCCQYRMKRPFSCVLYTDLEQDLISGSRNVPVSSFCYLKIRL